MEKPSLLIVCIALLVSNTAAQGKNMKENYIKLLLSIIVACLNYYEIQPPTELHCNPMGALIGLQCSVRQHTDNVTWYWSRCVHDAGVKGTAILPGDTTDVFGVDVFGYGITTMCLSWANFSYYWCEISSAVSLRSSIITPVLQPTNTSLPECMTQSVIDSHNYKLGPECAAKGSPTICVPLPSFCPSVSV